MASQIERRKFLATLGGAAAAWPLAARAQQPDRMRRIGVLMGYAESDLDVQDHIAAFREGLQKLGWTEGGTVRISVCERAIERYAAMALMKRSPNMTAN
jgi:putative ABC transport system substrate-binding protein